MSELDDRIAEFRNALAAREARVVREMVRQYAELQRVINARVAQLPDSFERSRLIALEREIVAEMTRIAGAGYRAVLAEQAEAVRIAGEATPVLLSAATGPLPAGASIQWARLNTRAAETIVGGFEGPLRSLFASMPRQTADAVRDALLRGVAVGRNPQQTARAISDALGGNLTRSMSIARTEQHRAYRAATVEGYRANGNVVKGWIWLSSLDTRTCPACFAMHGTEHPPTEEFGSHPACRCSPAPLTRSMAELTGLNIPETAPQFESGVEKFEELSPSEQIRILRPAAYRAWRSGAISLEDLVQVREHPIWGTTRSVASLKSVLGDRARQFYTQSPPREMRRRVARRKSRTA